MSKKVIQSARDKVDDWSPEQWVEYKRQGDQLYAEFAAMIDKKLFPASSEVQALVKKHYEFTKLT